MPSILFVCTANICRSPMAMALFKNKVENDLLDWRIESAGTWANEGLPASNNSQQTLNDYGIDLSSHASRSVERISLTDYDLILVMEQGHKEALKVEYRNISDRVYLLYEMVGLIRDVHDPYGGRLVDYTETADEINQILTEGLDKIKEIALENEKVRLNIK
jgi:protein-tyrosine-phosphatase